MITIIFFKLNIFLSGMAIAYAYLAKENKRKVYWILISILSLFNAKIHIFIIAALIILLLFFDENSKDILSRIGNGKLSKFLGDTSYGLYLMHLPVMYPILYILFSQDWFLQLPIYPRLLMTVIIISPVVYGLAYLVNRFIELPGIRFGKRITANNRRDWNWGGWLNQIQSNLVFRTRLFFSTLTRVRKASYNSVAEL